MNITDRAMLVNLSIKQWSAAKHDKRASAEVASNHNSDVNMGRFHKQLVCKEAMERLKKIANSARTEHYKRTLSWQDDGARILSSAGYFDYSSKMRDYQYEWDIAVHEFVSEYPSYVAEARLKLNGLFNPAEYPSARIIADKFAFGFNVMPLPTSQDFRVDLGNSETARIRAEIESQVQSTIDGAMSEVWTRIRDAVSHMAEKLRAYNVSADGVANPFRDSLVQNIRDLVTLLPSLNITDDANVTEFSARMERELCTYSPDSLRVSQHAREETARAAEDILSKMEQFI